MNRGAAAILRFKHEFRTLLGIAHPNLVTLYELISDGQNWFLTMELLDGVTFLEYVSRRRRNRPGFDGDWSAGAFAGRAVRSPARRLDSSVKGSPGFTQRESCTGTSNRRT